MGFLYRFRRKKDTEIEVPDHTIVGSSGEPIDKSKRKCIKIAGQGMAVVAAVQMGLIPKDAHAYSINSLVPPLFREDLCVDPELARVFYDMMSGTTQYKLVLERLVSTAGSSHVDRIDPAMRFCHPGSYIAMNTFIWKYRKPIDWGKPTYDALEQKFYHNFALHRGIDLFYRKHVTGKDGSNEVERFLLENIFGAAEENPRNGIVKAQEYLSGSFADKTRMIAELSQRYQSMRFSESEKLDHDLSGTQGKGPLNNWHRLLSGQTGAFFLANHYWTIAKHEGDLNHNLMELIYNNIEEPISKMQSPVRGPPFYINKRV